MTNWTLWICIHCLYTLACKLSSFFSFDHEWTFTTLSTHSISQNIIEWKIPPHLLNNTYTQSFYSSQDFTGTTWVSWYQKKHSPTHIYRGHQSSLICFLHLSRSMASSLINLRAWQTFSTISLKFSLVYLLAWHPPYISSPNHEAYRHMVIISFCLTSYWRHSRVIWEDTMWFTTGMVHHTHFHVISVNMDSDIWKLIYLGYEKSQHSVTFDLPALCKYPYWLTYLFILIQLISWQSFTYK